MVCIIITLQSSLTSVDSWLMGCTVHLHDSCAYVCVCGVCVCLCVCVCVCVFDFPLVSTCRRLVTKPVRLAVFSLPAPSCLWQKSHVTG